MNPTRLIGIEQSAVIVFGQTRSLILPLEPAFVELISDVNIRLNDLQKRQKQGDYAA